LEKERARDRVRETLLHRYGIEASGGVYDTLCHEEPFFRTIPKKVLNVSDSFPQAEFFARRQLCLPLYPGLTKEEQQYVSDCLEKSLKIQKKKR